MAKKIELSTKMETFEIEFKDRNTSVEISFNASDPELAVRFDDMRKRIGKKLNNITNIELDEKGNPHKLDEVDIIRKLNKCISDEIDFAFGNKISDKLFQFCSPMAITGNELFVEQFIKAITPVIKETVMKNNRELDKHLAKYTK